MAFNTTQFLTLATSELETQLKNSVRIEAAIRFAVIAAIFIMFGFKMPELLSGFRTLADQRLLRQRLGAKAATRSWHTVGLAFDLDPAAPTFDVFARLWVILGGRDGRTFRTPDPGHLDFPIEGITPPSI